MLYIKREVQPKTSITTKQIYAHMLLIISTVYVKMLTEIC